MGGPGRPILVLDDDPDLVRLMRTTLEKEGWTVHVAGDAREALEHCEQHKPAMIFLDLMLPHMDGEEFVLRLRERHGNDLPPIVVVSASTVRAEVASRIGANASLRKPFQLEDISALATKYADT